MRIVYTLLLFVLPLIGFCQNDKVSSQFVKDFKDALKPNLSEEELNQLFQKHDDLIFPGQGVNQMMHNLKGEQIAYYPLASFKTNRLYQNNIPQLLESKNQYHRILAYITIGSAHDTTFNKTLLSQLVNEDNKGGLLWSAMALLYMKDKHTTALFNYLVKHENFGDAHLIPLFIQLDKDSLRATCREKIHLDDPKAKILALQTLALTDESTQTDSLIIESVQNWDIKLKGYAIAALQKRKLGDLRPLLEPLLAYDEIRAIALSTLRKSSSESDRAFAEEIKKKKNW